MLFKFFKAKKEQKLKKTKDYVKIDPALSVFFFLLCFVNICLFSAGYRFFINFDLPFFHEDFQIPSLLYVFYINCVFDTFLLIVFINSIAVLFPFFAYILMFIVYILKFFHISIFIGIIILILTDLDFLRVKGILKITRKWDKEEIYQKSKIYFDEKWQTAGLPEEMRNQNPFNREEFNRMYTYLEGSGEQYQWNLFKEYLDAFYYQKIEIFLKILLDNKLKELIETTTITTTTIITDSNFYYYLKIVLISGVIIGTTVFFIWALRDTIKFHIIQSNLTKANENLNQTKEIVDGSIKTLKEQIVSLDDIQNEQKALGVYVVEGSTKATSAIRIAQDTSVEAANFRKDVTVYLKKLVDWLMKNIPGEGPGYFG